MTKKNVFRKAPWIVRNEFLLKQLRGAYVGPSQGNPEKSQRFHSLEPAATATNSKSPSDKPAGGETKSNRVRETSHLVRYVPIKIIQVANGYISTFWSSKSPPVPHYTFAFNLFKRNCKGNVFKRI